MTSGNTWATGPCVGCKRLFSFNPEKVTSAQGPDHVKRPLCRSCAEKVNVILAENGQEQVRILDGAYAPENLDIE